MRCLVIAPQPFFTPRGTPFSVYYRTLIMSELGAAIDIVTYGEGKDPDIPNVAMHRVPRFRFLGKVKTGPSLLKLFLDFFIGAKTLWLLIRNRYDIVHAHEEAVFICRFLKPVFRFKLVYDMHSSLTQQLTNFEFTESRIVHWIFKTLEDSSIRTADAVITVCPDLAGYVTGIIDDVDKLYLIENSIHDPVKLKGEANDRQAGSDGDVFSAPANRFCFIYAGTLETYQGIDLLLRAFSQVLQSQAEAFLLVVGGTPEQVDEYKRLASELRLDDHCYFTGRVSQRLANHYTSIADAQLSTRIDGTNTPLKIYQQLASGIPLVATDIYSHTQVLNEKVAFLAPPQPDSLASAMISAMTDEAAARSKVEAAASLYEREYSRESYVRKLSGLMGSL